MGREVSVCSRPQGSFTCSKCFHFFQLLFSMCIFWNTLYLWFCWQQFPGVFCDSMKIMSPSTSSLMTAFLLCAICMKPCYCVDPFVPPVLGWIFSQLICLLWAKERFSASARTLPCSYGEGGEPQHLVAIWFWLICGFNHFLLAEDYPALCSLLGTDSWKWSFPSVCWDSEYLCVFEEASKLTCTWWTFLSVGGKPIFGYFK